MSANPDHRHGGRQREPILNLPGAVIGLIAVLALVHVVREFLSAQDDFLAMVQFAFVPARMTVWFSPDRLNEVVESIGAAGSTGVVQHLRLARFLLGDGEGYPWTLLTYGLLHGSWPHLLTNVVWLAAFGSPVARRLGPMRFLLLFAAATVGGALLHWWARPLEVLPLVGASAGVSGAMAAAIRFVFSPGVHFSGLGDDAAVRAIPAERFGSIWRNSRALLFIVVWFVTNILFGAGLVPIFGEESSIAWEAHIGGFVAGLLLFPLLDRGPVRPR